MKKKVKNCKCGDFQDCNECPIQNLCYVDTIPGKTFGEVAEIIIKLLETEVDLDD